MKLTPWTPIEATDVAEGAPDSAGLNLALRDNAKHCQQLIYDEDTQSAPGSTGHLHRGDESSNVGRVYPSTPNLLIYSYANGSERWKLHSGTQRTNAGFAFSSGGQWVSLLVGDVTRPRNSLSMFGAGAHLVVSGCLIADQALTKGSIQFGLSTGGSSGEDDEERSFVSGGRIDIPAQLVSTSWRRFWGVVDTEGVEFSKSVRFTVQCRGSVMPVGATITANLFDLRVGQLLDYPVLSYVTDSDIEISGFSFGDGNKNWQGYGFTGTSGGPPPPLDHGIMITNAIKLKAR